MNIKAMRDRLPAGKAVFAKPWLWMGAIVAVGGMIASAELQQRAVNRNALGALTWSSPEVAYAPLQHAAALPAMLANAGSAGMSQATDQQAANATTTSTAPSEPSRMIIETATVDIRMQHPEQAANQINRWLASEGGFVANLQENTTTITSISMTVRVPETDFSRFLTQSRGLGKVLDFSQSGQDVTQQYNNLSQQLTERQSEAQAYTRLFNKAQSMKDMIQIQQSLAQVNAQVSQLEAQIHGLDKSVQFATVYLALTEPGSKINTPTTQWPMVSALDRSWHVLTSSFTALLLFFAWLVPWVALFAAVSAGLRFWLRRRK